jgi:hypothetical protein
LITNRRHHFVIKSGVGRSRPSSVHYCAGGTTARCDSGPVGVRLSRLGLGNCTTQPSLFIERVESLGRRCHARASPSICPPSICPPDLDAMLTVSPGSRDQPPEPSC